MHCTTESMTSVPLAHRRCVSLPYPAVHLWVMQSFEDLGKKEKLLTQPPPYILKPIYRLESPLFKTFYLPYCPEQALPKVPVKASISTAKILAFTAGASTKRLEKLLNMVISKSQIFRIYSKLL